MVKTTIYIDERDAAALRRMSRETGRSQAEIIREAIGMTTRTLGPRKFASAGVGRGTGEAISQQADEILRQEMGARKLEEMGSRKR
jgi:predicted DNA-binding protein